jgi:SpoVK/Ycf46/Vps4 family AAA+-type ATPase
MAAYTTSLDHLFAELKRLDALLKRAVILARSDRPSGVPDDFRGLAVFETEIDALLSADSFVGQRWRSAAKQRDALNEIDHEIADLRRNIDADVEVTLRQGDAPRLVRLATMFGLSPAEVDIVLIALAPEVEPRYEQLFSYLQNDVTRRRPSVDLVLNLLAASPAEKVKTRALLDPGAPLLHFHLVSLEDEAADRRPPLLRRWLKLSEGVTQYLLGHETVSVRGAEYHPTESTIDDVECSTSSRQDLDNLISVLERTGLERAIIHLTADHIEAAQVAAAAIAHALQRPLLAADLSFLAKEPEAAADWWRDSALWEGLPAVTHWQNIDDAETPSAQPLEEALWSHYTEIPSPVLLLGSEFTSSLFPVGTRVFPLHLSAPEPAEQRETWQAALAAHPNGFDLAQLAEAFPLPRAAVSRIVSIAEAYASVRNPSAPKVTMEDLLHAGRSLSTPRLSRFAISIDPRYSWEDIVLPPGPMAQLKRLAGRLRNRARVMQEWGFGEKMSRGRGLSILFVGPPGTGKTMAAEVLSRELNLRLFQIDLPSVVSKYIGDTEKHLSAIFREAELTQSLLFFDEADALFGKRTEIKDAHDRHANIEINYLLQRLEVYEGPVVLSTNFEKNLDEAFLRRLQDLVEFPMPDEHQRELIWRKHLPKAAPQEDLDFTFLARQFPLSGGGIRNALLSAAFQAAEAGESISMRHIVPSIQLELHKQGRLVMKSDLGQYFRTTPAGVM